MNKGSNRTHHQILYMLAFLALISLSCNITIDMYPTATPYPTVPPVSPENSAPQPPLPTQTPYPTFTPVQPTIAPPTLAPLPTNTLPQPAVNQPTATATKGGKPSFEEITKDAASFACGGSPTEITIKATVNNPDEVYYITLFYKLTDKITGKQTEYQTENLNYKGGNVWSLTLPATWVANPEKWDDTWLTYQLVLQVKGTKELIRSDYFNDISFKPCK